MSELRTATVSDLAGTGPVALTKQNAAKIYARFNAAGSATESLNVSSVTDHGTGDASLNFTNNMGSVNYSFGGSVHSEGSTSGNFMQVLNANTPTASAIRLSNSTFSGTIIDPNSTGVAMHGDLA